jgi:hypothetical protein
MCSLQIIEHNIKKIEKSSQGKKKCSALEKKTMKIFFNLSLALLCVVLVGFVSAHSKISKELATKIGRTFYFENHGRDDVRELRATFLKGVRVIKVDFNFRENASECVQQKYVNPNGTLTPSDFPNGCFVLTHYYDPVVPDYSTPYQLLDMIAMPQIKLIFSLPSVNNNLAL